MLLGDQEGLLKVTGLPADDDRRLRGERPVRLRRASATAENIHTYRKREREEKGRKSCREIKKEST